MSLLVYCDKCGDEIDEPGALVFGPPTQGSAKKFHICDMCWIVVELFVTGKG